ncbi:MAG TPA: protoporphyrinogen oxidase [Pirellulales bacterium]|nr:protoporphyrinogen oxidase [Pirellulales bacterium]
MTSPLRRHRSIAVVGAGISGLAAAFRLRQLDPAVEVLVLEERDRPGGVLSTVHRDGFLIERGADNFITNVPWAIDLCRQVGLADDLSPTDSRFRQVFVVRGGRLRPIPPGFMLMVPERIGPVLASSVLSPWGKLRLLCEYFVPVRKTAGDESLASFVRRRLGREAFDRLVQPLIGGIYTADPEKLSLAATLPRFLNMEREAGGLLRGRRASSAKTDEIVDPTASGARYGLFAAPRGGMGAMIDALVARLPAGTIRFGTRATALARMADGRWEIRFASGGSERSSECDGVVFAVPAPAAAGAVRSVSAALADELGGIPYADAVVVSLGYRREQIAHRLDGFGVVVPACEQRAILAASFSSVKFAGRAPEGHVLLRVFVGGACQPELARLDDERIRRLVLDELAALIGARGEPVVCEIARWPGSMAQYHLGHLERVARIERLLADLPGLALAGNAYRGVGIAQCIHSGTQAAETVLAAANKRTGAHA